MHLGALDIEPPRAGIDPIVAERNRRARTRHLLAELKKARKGFAAARAPKAKAEASREVLRLKLEWRFLQRAIKDGRPINPPPSRLPC